MAEEQKLNQILEAVRGLSERMNEINSRIAELGTKTDSNAKAIEGVRAEVSEMAKNATVLQ